MAWGKEGGVWRREPGGSCWFPPPERRQETSLSAYAPMVNAMPRKQFKRAICSSPLTPEEAARDKERRQKIMTEFPPLEPAAAEPGGISDTLRTAIKESPKSVYQICQDAGISQIVVSRFLSGQRDIRLATADRLARTLGLAIART